MKECPQCKGYGYYANHAPADMHGEDGECVFCPMQYECELCETKGKVPDDYKEPEIIKVTNDLPF